ncbi:putative tetratricopeptide repeat protein 1 [Diplodia seriata]|uniref:Putative tetratricopeptide repeat protein 1 n=1 Tax=Diplodia seriata TaxID=420778 RepID=A0A0G2GL18_9PEZI|nr:putative tetratricopeptide repeat protein 1 [Diplodia seriata]
MASSSPTPNPAAPAADELAASASDNPVFNPDEEASLLATANQQKTHANTLFTSGAYSDAISAYGRALASVPNYLDYEIAVLRANVAACHVKLEEWKEAVEAAGECLERLEGLDGGEEQGVKGTAGKNGKAGAKDKTEAKPKVDPNVSGVVEELSDSDDDAEAKKPETPKAADTASTQAPGSQDAQKQQQEEEGKGQEANAEQATHDAALLARRLAHLRRLSHTPTDVRKLRTKALLRRAKARSSLGGWSDLQGAEDDYRTAAATPGGLSPLDKKAVDQALRELPARLNAAKDKEVGEMMGKLKNLGNGLLKPFGLSTDSFNFVKDEKTGGYSVQMQ